MTDQLSRRHVVGATISELSGALWREIDDTAQSKSSGTTPFYGVVTGVAEPLIQVRALGDDAPAAGENWYARLVGAPLVVGDTVLVQRTGEGTPIVVSKVGGQLDLGAGLLVASSDAPARVKAVAWLVCDGVADEVQINQALAALGPYGGTVRLSQGRFFVSNSITIDDYQALVGAGCMATVLFLASGANCPVIITADFAALVVGDTTGGPTGWSVTDLAIDLNKANNVSGSPAGYGFRIYGHNYRIERVIIHHGNIDGIWTQWSSSASPGSPHSMEARITDVEIHNCDGIAIFDNGPHDMMLTRCIVWSNGRGFWTYTKGNAAVFQSCHTWGAGQDWGYVLEGHGAQLDACIGEGGSGGQVYITSNDAVINGGYYFQAEAASGKGIEIAGSAAGYMIRTKVLMIDEPAIDHSADGGLGWIELLVYSPVAATAGTPHASSKRVIRVHGGGSGDVDV